MGCWLTYGAFSGGVRREPWDGFMNLVLRPACWYPDWTSVVHPRVCLFLTWHTGSGGVELEVGYDRMRYVLCVQFGPIRALMAILGVKAGHLSDPS